MLQAGKVIAFAASADLRRARAFYEQVLGLRVTEQNDFACVFDANGAGQPPPGPVGFGPQRQRGGVGSGLGLGQRERRHRVPGGHRGQPAPHDLLPPGLQDGVGAKALQSQRGLRLGALRRQRLP